MENQDLLDRLERAQSWNDAADKLRPNQLHEAFLFRYIAFNAMYGRRQYEGNRTQACQDRERFLENLQKMHSYDVRYGRGVLLKALMACHESAGMLVGDHFTNDEYWRYPASHEDLQKYSSVARSRVEALMRKGQWRPFLDVLLQHLTVLRNQVMHGCVTYGPKSKGMDSIEAGTKVMKEIVPAFLELMRRYGQHGKWDVIPYPRLGSARHPQVGCMA